MKLLFTLFFSLSLFTAQAQFWGHWDYNFETPPDQYSPQFFIDTAYHNNIWQIGRPHKLVFDSAHTVPNAIVTDTLNSYAINDTSVFIMRTMYFIPNGPNQHWFASEGIRFDYRLDIDTTEIARVEISLDSMNWINCLDSSSKFIWQIKPDLTKSTVGWKTFYINFVNWNSPLAHVDSSYIYIRFTFISDSIQTNKDGWMLDNFSYDYWTEGIDKLQNNNLINIYPNPSNGNIYIRQNSTAYSRPTVSIINIQGQEVYQTDKVPGSGYLHLSLPDGIYMLKYILDDEYAVRQIVIKN